MSTLNDYLVQKHDAILVIMSRTFGGRIRHSLRQQGYSGHIVTLDEM
jgi:hypothetical protein